MNPNEPLRTKNLAEEDPAPMDDTLGGYPWLPRMIDKARAADAGTLGDYFKYPCPIDATCLGLLGLDAMEFASIARESSNGLDVTRRMVAAGLDATVLVGFDPVALNESLHAERTATAGRPPPLGS